jgi:hypothetical protein
MECISGQKSEQDMKLCYNTKRPVLVKRKNDLVTLCAKEIIPEELHNYLPTNKKEKGYVPMESDEDDTDFE